MARPQYTSEQRISSFWKRVNKNGSIPVHCPELGHCWEWLGGKNRYGYGTLKWAKKDEKAHRISWYFVNGDIPNDLCVLHKCDNRICCNPKHLFLGTRTDNAHDRDQKGRTMQPPHKVGEKHPNAKLTIMQINDIRNRYAQGGISQSLLASEYGVIQPHISRIIRKANWK